MYRDHCWQTLLLASDIENVVILGGDIENVGTFRGLRAVPAIYCCLLWTLGVPMTCFTCLMLKVQKQCWQTLLIASDIEKVVILELEAILRMLAHFEASELCQHFNVACCGPWVSQ